MVDAVLSGTDYDAQWQALGDFIRYNPGARHRRRLSLRMLAGLSPTDVLDVGCGTGEMLLTLRRELPGVQRWVGSDFAAETLAANAERMPWATFVRQDIVAGPLDDQFDLVTCCEVLEHLADRPAAFANLAAMVRPGGALLVTCPTGRIYETERRFGHVSHPTQSELDELGEAEGLDTLRSLNWGWPLYRAMKWATNVNADWAMAKFGSGSYSRGEKLINWILFVANHLNVASPLGCQLFCLYRKPGR